MNYSLFFCEGIWDSFFIFRVLQEKFNFEDSKKTKRIDARLSYLTKLFETSKIFVRHTADYICLIVQCGSKDHTIKNADTIIQKHIIPDQFPLSTLGIFVDMDDMTTESLNQKINIDMKFKSSPIHLGIIQDNPFKYGVWAFPDCMNQGAIEKTLLDLYKNNYKDLISATSTFLDEKIPQKYKMNADGTPWNNRRHDKAIVCQTASILQVTGLVTQSIAHGPIFSDPLPDTINSFVDFTNKLINVTSN